MIRPSSCGVVGSVSSCQREVEVPCLGVAVALLGVVPPCAGGTILKGETDTPKQGTYTYQGKEVTLTTTHQDDGKIITSIVRLVMDDTNQTLAGTVTEDGVRKGIIYTRKK